ncbi:MAG: PhoH family protein [Planctomycetota bacterium]
MKFRRKIRLPDDIDFVRIFGPYDQHLKLIRNKLDVKIVIRPPGDPAGQSANANSREISISGQKKPVETAFSVIQNLVNSIQPVTEESVISLLNNDTSSSDRSQPACRQAGRTGGIGFGNIRSAPNPSYGYPTVVGCVRGDVFGVKAKTEGQGKYLNALQNNDIVIAIGPAGTGKTYLAVARALMALKKNEIRKIILCRPAVEAGEKLGFLPGDYQAKVNPYLRPLYDALNGFLEYQQLRRLIDTEIVEVVPLAYMRGRNLDNAFMILDEAQNTTSEQMKMFLTRMGQNSKIIVTGDITQIDLPPGKISGLIETQSVLAHIKGITFCYLTRADIVRHPLVQSIVDAYESRKGTHPSRRPS